MKRLLILALLFTICTQCTERNKFIIFGHWIIDKIEYKEFDLTHEAWTLNYIVSQNGIEYILPSLIELNEESSSIEGRGVYFNRDNKRYIFFKTTNQYFNDTFEIRVIRKDTFEIFNHEKYAKFHDAYIYSH